MSMATTFVYGSEIIFLALGIVYFFYRFITAKKVYKSIDEPIEEFLDEWSKANNSSGGKTKKKSSLNSSKKYHYAYNKVSVDYLSIILAELKSMKEAKGIGASVSDLTFKLLPMLVFVVTLTTTSVWNMYNFSQKNTDLLEDKNQKISYIQDIVQGITNLSDTTIQLIGIIMFLFLIVFVFAAADVFFYDKRSEENQKRISIIEEIMKHRKVELNCVYITGQLLTSEKNFSDATLLSIPIEVYLDDKLCNKGIIQDNKHDRVIVNNSDYSKSVYSFITC